MLKYQIGLTLLPDIGDISAKKFVAYCGGVEAVFKENRSSLEKIPGIGKRMVNSILNQKVFEAAEKEIEFIDAHDIQPIFYLDKQYPHRLLNCDDSPILLYYKGNTTLNAKRVISIVGMRKMTRYGEKLCEQLVKGLSAYDVQIISGLAYGVDACAHRSSLNYGLETIGVLGHGLDRIYPAQNKNLASEMLEHGGLLSEYRFGTNPDAQNFPSRNRIVAGMSDATIVIESGARGGSLITADLAFHYNRDVMAFPGNTNQASSKGCNLLIQRNKAMLITSAEDVIREMNWKDDPNKKIQRQIFVELDDKEQALVDIIKKEQECGIDILSIQSEMTMTSTSSTLLNLELKGVVKSLPGKRYGLL